MRILGRRRYLFRRFEVPLSREGKVRCGCDELRRHEGVVIGGGRAAQGMGSRRGGEIFLLCLFCLQLSGRQIFRCFCVGEDRGGFFGDDEGFAGLSGFELIAQGKNLLAESLALHKELRILFPERVGRLNGFGELAAGFGVFAIHGIGTGADIDQETVDGFNVIKLAATGVEAD